jgi:hypothetical protein
MKIRDLHAMARGNSQEVTEPSPQQAPAKSIQPEPTPWPCRRCGRPAKIEAVEPRQSDGVLLTFWHCEPCQTWGVTPDTLRQPPVWVSQREQ